ncbi:hypothetical protein VYU27_010253, partial [Nannochloropsis oceanica]
MRVCSTFGTFIYAGSTVLATWALLTLAWSTSSEPTLTVDGMPTSVFMRMGPFGMKARVSQAGAPLYTADAFHWCSRTDPGPIFDEPTHQFAYCTFLTATQISGVVSCALGMAGIFLAFLLACNSIKNKERKHVTGLLASVMFFQFIGALGCVVSWVCLNQIAASDLDVTLPGADLYFGKSWFAMT